MGGLSVIMFVAGERPRSRQLPIGDITILLQWAIGEVLELDYALFKSHTYCKQQENCMKCTLSRNSTRYQMEALKPASAKDPKCA